MQGYETGVIINFKMKQTISSSSFQIYQQPQVFATLSFGITHFIHYYPQFNFSPSNLTHFQLCSPQKVTLSPLCQSNTQENSSSNYISQRQRSIILRTKIETKASLLKSKHINSVHEQKKKKERAINQKQSRNVMSNLLRIFFKNILEINLYQDLIDRILTQLNSSKKHQHFEEWLSSFRINFKNYIRIAQIQKILVAKSQHEFQVVLRILLNHYINSVGLMHTLNSKRIEKRAVKMHLEGLRMLKKDLLSWSGLEIKI